MLELFVQVLFERKILFVSRHKSLLTQAVVALMSFIFPLCWKHTLIPILPAEMIDYIDSPYIYLIGIESQVLSEACLDLNNSDVT